MKQKIIFAFIALWLLCHTFVARGQTPVPVSGPDTVCVGTPGGYSVVPTTGVNYVWTVAPPFGVISGPNTNPTLLVLWGMPGTAIVSVEGYDAATGTHVETGNMPVTVMPTPVPYITADITVGCQTLSDSTPNTPKGGPGHIDDDDGCVKVCEGSAVTYTGHGPAGSTYGWVVTGGTILTAAADTCVVLWGTPGAGSITLSDTSIYGCVGYKSVCIQIIEKPNAFFYAIPNPTLTTINVCLGTTVIFKDSSTGSTGSPILNWFWYWGDGTMTPAASSTSLPHTFNTVGTDTVTLVVRNACGCTDTFRMEIIVDPTTGVEIKCPRVVCEGDTASYTLNPVPPCGLYNWSVIGGTIVAGAGTASITVLWDNVGPSGFGYVTFDAATCGGVCPGLTTIKVPVITDTGYIAGPDIVCANDQYIYSMPEWPTTEFVWSITTTTGATLLISDQTNQIVLNTVWPGIVYLECKYNNTLLGCGGIARDTIQVLPRDSISGQEKICLLTTGTYSLAGGGSTANWTLYNPMGAIIATSGSPVTAYAPPIFTLPGNYVLTATYAGAGIPFCPPPAFVIKVLPLPPPPDSLLGPDTTCFGSPARYIAKNALPGNVFVWAAATGICNFSSGDHTDATFSGGSPATIMVWRENVEAPHCHSDTLTKLVYRPDVHVNITGPDTVCPSSYALYSAGYTEGETYEWKIITAGRGSVELDGKDTARVLWNNIPGPARVTLMMRRCDSVYRDTLNVYVRPIPAVVIMMPDTICSGVLFTASVSPLVAAGGTVDWDWGDGSPHSSGASASHIYNNPAATNTTFNVVATITNPYGCVGIAVGSRIITVLPAPSAYISPAGPFVFCGVPVDVYLTATLTSGFEPTATLEWYSGAGFITSCTAPTFICNPHHVTTPGVYYAVAIGVNGCSSVTNSVIVDTTCPPTPPAPCVLNPDGWARIDTVLVDCGVVHLAGSYATTGLTAFSWTWIWPVTAQGVVTTNTTLDCHFDVAGLYSFSYTVGLADAFGDTCYVTGDTSVLVPFIAGMRHSVSCAGGSYTVTMFDNSSYYPGYPPLTYDWYVDGSLVGSTSAPTSSFSVPLAPGGHSLGMWADYGVHSCYANDTVYLDTLPVAGFTFHRDTTCANQASVQFTNTSVPGSGLSYLWSFGDGTGNTVENPHKVYSTPILSIYPVNLTVTNRYGCFSSFVAPVVIIPENLDGRLIGDTVVCSGQPATLMYQNSGAGYILPEQYYWKDDLDTVVINTSSVLTVYTSGSYWVSGFNHFGCYVNTDRLNVNVIQTPPAVITGDNDACLNVPYTLNGWAGSDPSISYQWYKNGMLVGTADSYTDPAALAGIDVYQLIVCGTVLGVTCCDTSALFTVTVHPAPPAPWIMASMLDCNAYEVQLTATGPSYGWYNWSNGLSGQVVNAIGGGPYRVWYTDTFGCTSHGNFYMPRDPREFLWTFPTGCYTFCDDWFSSGGHYIVGPTMIPWFDWAYQYAPVGPVVMNAAGYGSYIPPFYPPGPGDYEMVLDNGYCRDTSGIMSLDLVPCKDCECLEYKLKGFVKSCPQPPSCCKWTIEFCVLNTCDPINATITVTGGSVSPLGMTIPTGYTCDTFTYSPSGFFNGGWVYFTINWYDGVEEHSCMDSVYLPPCRIPSKPGTDGTGSIMNDVGATGFSVVPNPASNTASIDYVLSSGAAGMIQVYDMTGRLISSHATTGDAGSWQLWLEDYAPGMYVVALREDGRLVQQAKLIVQR